jgi:hypothetical protein
VVLVLLLSLAFVLVSHSLAQETNGTTKSTHLLRCSGPISVASACFSVFLFWVQTLMIMMTNAHSAFGW